MARRAWTPVILYETPLFLPPYRASFDADRLHRAGLDLCADSKIKAAVKHPMILSVKIWGVGALAGQWRSGIAHPVPELFGLGRMEPHQRQTPRRTKPCCRANHQ